MSDSLATAKGHLHQEQQGLQSSKKYITPLIKLDDNEDDMFPLSDTLNLKQHKVVYVIMDTKSQAYIDLTVYYQHSSSRCNEYILVGYHHDDNNILYTPLRR